MLGLTTIGMGHWVIVISLSIIPTAVAEVWKYSDNYGFKWKQISVVD